MSALAEHPNAREARDLRRQEILHAARALYRDPCWIGEIKTGDWLLRVHYLREKVVMGWLEAAGINPWRPVCRLREDQRRALIRQMLAYAKAGER